MTGTRTMSCAACRKDIEPTAPRVTAGLDPELERARDEGRAETQQRLETLLKGAYDDLSTVKERLSKAGATFPAVTSLLPKGEPMPRPEWDALADKVIGRYIAEYGPTLSKSALGVYLRRMYDAFVREGLIVSTVEVVEKMVKVNARGKVLGQEKEPAPKLGPTLDEYLKGG